MYNVCLTHSTEKTWTRYFKHLDGDTKSPGYDGDIGLLFKNFEMKPIVNFEKCPGLVKKYDDDFVNSLNNDWRLFYDLCHGLMGGPETFGSLAERTPGHVHQVSTVT